MKLIILCVRSHNRGGLDVSSSGVSSNAFPLGDEQILLPSSSAFRFPRGKMHLLNSRTQNTGS